MREYHKIPGVFLRDTGGTKKLIDGRYRTSELEALKDIVWVFTEKVDGTNIRVHWDGHRVEIAGRTDRAIIPDELRTKLEELFLTKETEELFEQTFGEKDVILFGEGYGRKIQKAGSHYIKDGVSFILFDVLIGDNYQTRDWVSLTAQLFGVDEVPVILFGTLKDGVDYMKRHPMSVIAPDYPMEGLVGKPWVELRDRRGERIITKIKWDDMQEVLG